MRSALKNIILFSKQNSNIIAFPVDGISGVVSAYSATRKLRTTYTGYSFEIRRSSDNATLNIGFLPNGTIDLGTLFAFVGTSSGFIKTWYDQVGSNDVTQADIAKQPLIIDNGVICMQNFKLSAFFGKSAVTNLTCGSNIISSAQNSFIAVMCENTLDVSNCIAFGSATTNFFGYVTGFAEIKANNNIASRGYSPSKSNVKSISDQHSLKCITGIQNGATFTLYNNGTTLRVISNALQASSTFVVNDIGGGWTTGYMRGYISELIFFDTNISAPTRAIVESNINSFYGINTNKGLVIADGGSTTYGLKATDPQIYSYPSQLSALLGSGWEVSNLGVSGQTLVGMNSDAVNQIDKNYIAGRNKNILVCWGGANDIALDGVDGATAITRLETYCQARQAAGFDVVVVTLLPRTSNEAYETARQIVNAHIRENWATFADAVADIAADSRIGDAGDNLDTTYFDADGIHMNNTGYGVIASIVNPAVLSL